MKDEDGDLDCNRILDCDRLCGMCTPINAVYRQKSADIYVVFLRIYCIGAVIICRSVFLVQKEMENAGGREAGRRKGLSDRVCMFGGFDLAAFLAGICTGFAGCRL